MTTFAEKLRAVVANPTDESDWSADVAWSDVASLIEDFADRPTMTEDGIYLLWDWFSSRDWSRLRSGDEDPSPQSLAAEYDEWHAKQLHDCGGCGNPEPYCTCGEVSP